jgi:hypothetical protein
VSITSTPLIARVSHGHFSDINVMGGDFLFGTLAQLKVEHLTRTVVIESSHSWLGDRMIWPRPLTVGAARLMPRGGCCAGARAFREQGTKVDAAAWQRLASSTGSRSSGAVDPRGCE